MVTRALYNLLGPDRGPIASCKFLLYRKCRMTIMSVRRMSSEREIDWDEMPKRVLRVSFPMALDGWKFWYMNPIHDAVLAM